MSEAHEAFYELKHRRLAPMNEPLTSRWNLVLTIDPKEHGLVPKCGLDEAQAKIATLERDLAASKSREASPAMLRVVEAAKAYAAWWREIWPLGPPAKPMLAKLLAAVDALAAPAVEKPRYEAVASSGGWQEGGCVRDIKTQELVFGCWRQGDAYYHGKRCEEECARLNAEAAR